MRNIIVFILFLNSCSGNIENIKYSEKSISCRIYSLNYVDELHCKNCISSSFLTRISLNTIMKKEHLIGNSLSKSKNLNLIDCFEKSEVLQIIPLDIFNNSLVIEIKTKYDLNTFSYIGKGKWIKNDFLIIKPKYDVLNLVRDIGNLNDLTDYKYVSKVIQKI